MLVSGIGIAAACASQPEISGGGDGDGGSGASDGGPQGDGDGPGTIGGIGSGGDAGDGDGRPPLGGAGAIEAECGDGVLSFAAGEQCDDGDLDDGDGCSSTCLLEEGAGCPEPGQPCFWVSLCGNGQLSGAEQCDDANARDGDGCSSACTVEPGWKCPTVGARCEAAGCGDGIVAGTEQCEDDDETPESNDGCSDSCRLEDGYFCPVAGEACKVPVCGNGEKEGDEGCDDNNLIAWDGCSPDCEQEPVCVVGGGCSSSCGDGLILSGDDEECDDGNSVDGDGCSADCRIENGWQCTLSTTPPPDELFLPITYRDFIGIPSGTGPGRHTDFQNDYGGNLVCTGMVESTLTNGVPKATGRGTVGGDNAGCGWGSGPVMTSTSMFDDWFNDTSVSQRIDDRLCVKKIGSDPAVYQFTAGTLGGGGQYLGGMSEVDCSPQTDGFFPLNDRGWVESGEEDDTGGKNAGFTSVLRTVVEYRGGETLQFEGDDDVWVFVNGHLALDLGGMHPAREGCLDFGTPSNGTGTVSGKLGLCDGSGLTSTGIELSVGGLYEVVVFHAERYTGHSNFILTLSDFVKAKSECEVAECGDGFAVGDEVCDDGENNGKYGYCNSDCSGRGPHCGDGTLQEDQGEVCDNGANIDGYVFGIGAEPGCGPSCQPSAVCGDGVVDAAFGEQCEPSVNEECSDNCTYRAQCGDGVVNKSDGETCDDGNLDPDDGCSPFCTIEKVVR